jgi:hypothetical protein
MAAYGAEVYMKQAAGPPKPVVNAAERSSRVRLWRDMLSMRRENIFSIRKRQFLHVRRVSLTGAPEQSASVAHDERDDVELKEVAFMSRRHGEFPGDG